MTGGEVLGHLSAAGISCRLDAGEIVLTPAALITDELKAAILADRAAVVAAIGAAALPAWCTGWKCIRHEVIILPGSGQTPGCIIKKKGGEIWRRLDRLTGCPLETDNPKTDRQKIKTEDQQ